ncbi:hypothetical protein [Arthrobacter castelli]|uniref:hypothetical protein n=1 Tax=Arthrobacter castelli TaxID=271431 RepID=UPI0004115BFD|nr:hypothetical protein [Arthrobacter castelli]
MPKSKSVRPAMKIAAEAAFDKHGKPKPGLYRMMYNAVEVQRPLVLANLRRLRRRYPHASAEQLGKKLERDYLASISGGGAAVGATAVVPGIGTVASLSLSAAATVGFLEASALYAQSVAELHGVRVEDPERARTLVMAILLGEEGTAMVSAFASHATGRSGTVMSQWGPMVGERLPKGVVKSIGSMIRRKFMRNLLAKQGSALLGRAVPFGIGAAVGGAGNLMMGRSVIASTREAFGRPPETIPGELLEDTSTALPAPPAPGADAASPTTGTAGRRRSGRSRTTD